LNLSENLNNSFQYAKRLFTDPSRLVILTVLSVVTSRLSEIPRLLGMLEMNCLARLSITALLGLIGLVIGWILGGYYARTLRVSPSSEIPPPFDRYGELFVDGAKIFFAGIIYVLIPAILVVLGGFSFILAMFAQSGSVEPSLPDVSFGGFGLVLMVVGLILLIFILIILVAGIAHMIKTRKFGKAFAIREIFGIIRKIGWARYIGWMILIGIISLVVTGVAGAIPYIGWILSALVAPFLGVFNFRSLGILYNDGAAPELRVAAPVVTQAMVCTSCGTPLHSNQKFCPNCGTAAPTPPPPPPAAAMPESKFCISCGAKIPAGAKFCGTCGTKQA